MIIDMQNAVPAIEGLTDLTDVFPFPALPTPPSQLKETIVVIGSSVTPGAIVQGSSAVGGIQN